MNIVIVDDHPLVRAGLTSVLSLNEDFEVLGEAENKKEAVKLIGKNNPDIVLVDLQLGDDSGLDVIEEAIHQGVTSKFAILTSSTDEGDFVQAKEVNVDGYILKEALPEELIQALRIIHRGRKYYDPGVMEMVMNPSSSSGEDGPIGQLTSKEKEVLMELGKGQSNREISQCLFISEYTVKKHVSQILAKLELVDRTQAALYANAKGLVTYQVS